MSVIIEVGDCLTSMQFMEDQSVHCCITSPPYFGLRDYGVEGQIGLEPAPEEFVATMVAVFREVRRVLRDDGTVWLNLGDSYARPPAKGGSGPGGKNRDWYGDNYGKARGAAIPAGLKDKDLIGIPWRVAFALQADGWYLRQDIIWHKPNPMPESVRDRCTKGHEYIFLLSKSPKYHFDAEAIKEPAVTNDTRRPYGSKGANMLDARGLDAQGKGRQREVADGLTRNRRSVWTVPTKPFKGAHFAVFPPDLIEPCVLAGCPEGGTILDPFGGAGTTGLVAEKHGRNAILCELNPEYAEMAAERIGPSARIIR